MGNIIKAHCGLILNDTDIKYWWNATNGIWCWNRLNHNPWIPEVGIILTTSVKKNYLSLYVSVFLPMCVLWGLVENRMSCLIFNRCLQAKNVFKSFIYQLNDASSGCQDTGVCVATCEEYCVCGHRESFVCCGCTCSHSRQNDQQICVGLCTHANLLVSYAREGLIVCLLMKLSCPITGWQTA